MSLIGRLFDQLRPGGSPNRRLAPAEVRRLIDQHRLDEAEQAIERLSPDVAGHEAHAHALRGEVAFHRRQDQAAEEWYRRALEIDAGFPDAHYGLSLLFHSRGDKESALRHVLFAINGDRTQARFQAQAGLCQLELLNFARAEQALMQATRLAPEDRFAWNNLGIAQRARGNLPGAAVSFRRALELDPEYESARSNFRQLEQDVAELGVRLPGAKPRPSTSMPGDDELERVRELAHGGDVLSAIEQCESLLLSRPDDAGVPVELARLYRAHGDPQSGIDVLRAFRARRPEDQAAMIALGKILAAEHELKEAEPLLEAAVKACPDDAELWHELADIRSEQDRIADAGPMYERAYELQPTIENKARLAASLIARCLYPQALQVIDELLVECPLLKEEFVGYKVFALTSLGRHDEALPLLDQAISERPNDPMRRYPRAVIHLLNERYDIGWDDYRYRNIQATRHLRMLPFPEWQGEPLEGKSIIVLAEQGLGDQVMFASCLPDLLALGPRKVWLEAIARVAPTLARSFPGCEVIATKQGKQLDWVRPLQGVDYFVPLGDLPRFFRRSVGAFPVHEGYLHADPARVAHWRDTLAQLGPRPKIGVSWRGGLEGTRRVLRTMDSAMLAPLAAAIDADWVCLQYGKVDDDLALARQAGLDLHYWPESISNLDEFAALVSTLDLVITVCNTTVHYAGAVAAPTWILAPEVPEWRYGLRTKSLPWYPSTRVFRQHALGEWGPLLEQVRQELSAWAIAGAKNVTVRASQ